MVKQILNDAQDRMKKVIENLRSDFTSIRTGRASTGILDKVFVDYYGVPTPVNQVSSVSVPEPKMILIQPWDATTLPSIEKAILKSDLGLNPNNDGKVIRLVLPELTEERRKELVRTAKKRAEEAKIAIRNLRREYNDTLRTMERNGEISEDEHRRFEEETQKITDRFTDKVDNIFEDKEKDILEV